jgi:DNA primase
VSWDVAALLDSLEIEPVPRLSDDETFVCHCPSGHHADNTPSFYIRHADDEKQGLFICRSCGWGGNVFKLAMHCLNVGYPAAKLWVEEHAAAPEGPTPEAARVRVVRAAVFRLPPEVVVAPLEEWPAPPRAYAESRGIRSWQVDRWGIGYSLGGRLDGRVVIPIRDAEGRPRSYTARAYAGQQVRYLTPREEEGADPGCLFGEERAGEYPGAGVVVCEGALNALAVERVCEGPVLALGGSRVDQRAILKIARFAFAVVLTDSDPAGDKAADALWRGLRGYVPLARARLPEGFDPANCGPAVLTGELERAIAEARRGG